MRPPPRTMLTNRRRGQLCMRIKAPPRHRDTNVFGTLCILKIYTRACIIARGYAGVLVHVWDIVFDGAQRGGAPACLAPPHSDIKTYTLSDQPIARDLDFNQTLRQCAPCFEATIETIMQTYYLIRKIITMYFLQTIFKNTQKILFC